MTEEDLEWRSVEEELPPVHQTVLVLRQGGKQNQTDVQVAFRTHKFKTRDEWEWRGSSLNPLYVKWGVACDGSVITHWKPIPAGPQGGM